MNWKGVHVCRRNISRAKYTSLISVWLEQIKYKAQDVLRSQNGVQESLSKFLVSKIYDEIY